MTKNFLLATATAFALLAAAPSHASIITNGDFETGTLSGWTATGNVLAVLSAFSGFTDPAYGQYVALFNTADTSPTGVLSQTIATLAGQDYVLTFDYGVYGPTPSGQSLRAEADDGATTLAFTSAITLSAATQTFSLAFTAISGSTTILFTDFATNDTISQDGALDNVSVAAVPEPATLTLLGIGAAAMIAGRRKRAGISKPV